MVGSVSKLKNVLIIDDQKTVRTCLLMSLANLGFNQCFEADNGKSAFDIVKHTDIDIIFCDINMPVSDGFDVLRHLESIEFKGKVILITGEDEEIAKSMVDLGKRHSLTIIGFLKKPVKIDDINRILLESDGHESLPLGGSDGSMSVKQLEKTLSESTIIPFFQPQVSLKTGEITGVEALARIKLNDGTILYPDSFIQPAEKKLELILKITKDVIYKSLNDINSHQDKFKDVQLSVNISAAVLSHEPFTKWLVNTCEKFNVKNERITCELTETAYEENKSEVAIQMLRLRLLKFRLSIDDFGTGYSSIEQLQAIPFQELKLDKLFIMGLIDNPKSAAIVEQSINMAKALNIEVVAEGVETEEITQILRKLGCDIGQGYLYSKPVPMQDLIDVLECKFH